MRGIAQICSRCGNAFVGSDCIELPILCFDCKYKLKTELDKIPPEFRCSRCKRDLREKAKYPCDCLPFHPIGKGNASGNKTIITDMEYRGTKD